MTDYTPDTHRVRNAYAQGNDFALAEFDRWLAAELAKEYQRGREDATDAAQDAFLAMRLEFDGLLRRLFHCISDAARGGSHE